MRAVKRAQRPLLLGCPACKRPDGSPHDESFCTPERRANAEAERLAIDPPAPMKVRQGPAPTLPATWGQVNIPSRLGQVRQPDRDGPAALHEMHPDELSMRGKRGAEARIRSLAERKETTVPTLAEATANLGLPAPSTDAAAEQTAVCAHCGPQPITAFSIKLNGDPFAYCDAHRSPKSRQAPAAAGSVNETPIATAAAGGTSGFAASIVVEKQEPQAANPLDADQLLGLVGETDEDLVGGEWIAEPEPVLEQTDPALLARSVAPSPISGPNGSAVKLAPLSHLRAERERLTAYLQDLDRRIEEAEVFEQLAGKTPAELQQLLDDAQRTARLCELALQGVA